MLTFDDTKLDQYTAAIPELKKYGFKAVFYIMTVSLGKPNYMSKAQVKELSELGHVIGSHTYDHQNVKNTRVMIGLHRLKTNQNAKRNYG